MRSANRRSFLRRFAGGLFAAAAAPAILSAQDEARHQTLRAIDRRFAANERIRVGAVGMGIQGFANVRTALRIPGVELAAVCDLYDGRLERSKEVFGGALFTTRDYRELLRRADIDAVIVSTSDHWHDHISIAALEAGKAVYCEKPMVHHLEEGHAMIAAQRKSGKPLQVGSQGVSSILTWKARELFAQGHIGPLVLVEAFTDRHSPNGAWQYSIPPDASEKTVDWQGFLGDAPKRPFDKTRFFRWRNYQDYGTGMAGDLYVHLFSALHTVIDATGPSRVYASGGLRYWHDGRDVPDVMLGVYDYPETKTHPAFNLQLRCNFVDGSGGGSRLRLIGVDGMIDIGWNSVKLHRHKMAQAPGYGGWDSFPTFAEATQKAFVDWYEKIYPRPKPEVLPPAEEEYRAPERYSDHYDHFANFFAAVREGAPVFEDAVFGLRAAGPSLGANLSYFQGKPIKWDSEKMVLVD
jgi:predicted dehydrogenase